MKTTLFKQEGLTVQPIYLLGILMILTAIAVLVPCCISLLKNDHSLSQDLYKVFVLDSCTALCWKWIG